jgi:hypothetical protein
MRDDQFIDEWLTALLWSTNDNSDESGGNPLDDQFSCDDFSDSDRRKVWAMTRRILWACQSLDLGECLGMDAFWHSVCLSQGRHGTGLWDDNDRGWKGHGKVLHAIAIAAMSEDEASAYIGDDGKVHLP